MSIYFNTIFNDAMQNLIKVHENKKITIISFQ
jgi:hypothetical protein